MPEVADGVAALGALGAVFLLGDFLARLFLGATDFRGTNFLAEARRFAAID
ncbi:MAG: hypothetical protein RLZZ586_1619, partial [Pseudomonadota bacterium]